MMRLFACAATVAALQVEQDHVHEHNHGHQESHVHVHAQYDAQAGEKQLEFLKNQIQHLLAAKEGLEDIVNANLDRFKQDKGQIDTLVGLQHKITDNGDKRKDAIKGIKSQITMLEQEVGIYKKKKNLKEAKYVEGVIKVLKKAEEDLDPEPQMLTIKTEIDNLVKDGTVAHKKASAQKPAIAALSEQLTALEKHRAALEDKLDATSGDEGRLESMDDGEYDDDSAKALERAVGWKQDKLEERATEAENALSNAVSGPKAVNALKGMLGMLR